MLHHKRLYTFMALLALLGAITFVFRPISIVNADSDHEILVDSIEVRTPIGQPIPSVRNSTPLVCACNFELSEQEQAEIAEILSHYTYHTTMMPMQGYLVSAGIELSLAIDGEPFHIVLAENSFLYHGRGNFRCTIPQDTALLAELQAYVAQGNIELTMETA